MINRFDFEPIFERNKKHIHKYMMTGVRRVGKSFSTLRLLAKVAILENRPFIFTTRHQIEYGKQRPALAMQSLIENPSNTDYITPLLNEIGIEPSDNLRFVVESNIIKLVSGKGVHRVTHCLIAYVTAVSEYDTFKKGSYPNSWAVFYDEFITENRYLKDEVKHLMLIYETLAVDGYAPYLFLCGNPDNEIEYCPYIDRKSTRLNSSH